jgi:hypothetical protein
MAIPTMAIMMY